MILRHRKRRIEALIRNALADKELSGWPLAKATGLASGTVYLALARLRDEGKVVGRTEPTGSVFYRWVGGHR